MRACCLARSGALVLAFCVWMPPLTFAQGFGSIGGTIADHSDRFQSCREGLVTDAAPAPRRSVYTEAETENQEKTKEARTQCLRSKTKRLGDSLVVFQDGIWD